jgi:hypothetical protein
VSVRVGREDPTLHATIVSRRALRYRDGGDAHGDRTGHVRAASGIAWARMSGGDRLVVAQDDASYLAVVDPGIEPPDVHALALAHVVEGRRVFESRLGNKRHKLDLEACTGLVLDGQEHVLVVGSGSLPVRERFVLVREDGHARIVDAARFYEALRAETRFSGSELNVEGVASLGERVVFVQRGNGAPSGELRPVDATCEVSRQALASFLAGGPVPPLEGVTQYELGEVGSVRLTFTDVTRVGDRLAFLAGAEASPDAIEDGAVAGVAIGLMTPGEDARWALVREADGRPYLGKAEGLAPRVRGVDDGRFWAVVDRDDPDHAAELLELALRSDLGRP